MYDLHPRGDDVLPVIGGKEKLHRHRIHRVLQHDPRRAALIILLKRTVISNFQPQRRVAVTMDQAERRLEQATATSRQITFDAGRKPGNRRWRYFLSKISLIKPLIRADRKNQR